MKPPKLRILVVDDNASDRLIVRSMLKKIGYEDIYIQEAEDGVVAERKILNSVEIDAAMDLILLDWNMPRTTGSMLLSHVRSIRRTRQIKIIVMTASADLETVKEAMASGANDFLVKPVQYEALCEKLQKLQLLGT